MRIGINVSWMTPGHVGGMEWYVRNLIDQLGVIDATNTYVLVTAPNNAHTFHLPNKRWKKVVYFGYENTPINYRVSLSAPVQRSKAYRAARWVYRRLKNLGVNPWRGKLNDHIRHENIDVWFCPLIYALPLDLDIPVVITIPDLQQEYYPDFFNEDEQAFRSMGYQYSCKAATAVIGISGRVAEDIQKLYHIDSARVFSIPLALEHSYQVPQQTIESLRNKVAVKYRLDDGYIFYPANGWPHKNHERLIEAIHILHQRGCHVRLVLTGYSLDLMDRLRPLLCEYGIQDAVRHLGHVERHEIIGLYAASAMLIFPSLFEGFGLPLLEAMHFGVPAACSRIGCLPEVGGDAVLYFNPNSAQDIADAILRILNDAELRERLANAGKEQISHFSYTTTAKQTLTVLEQIGNGILSAPNIPPFRPLIPHNWLRDGHGRWYFRSTSLQKIMLKVVQPLPVNELAQQHIEVCLNQQEVLRSSIEPQRPYDFVISINSADPDFYRLDITASAKFAAHGEQLSVRILNIIVVDSNNHELVLVK
jgi:glycosyltransferase involved in cell wall biosynthesis